MTIVEALKSLYVALGGNADDVSNLTLNADVIEAIASIATAGTELPDITNRENYKLMVRGDGSGIVWNANKYSIDASNVNATNKTATANRTAADILKAIQAGMEVLLNIKIGLATYNAKCIGSYNEGAGTYFMFETYNIGGKIIIFTIANMTSTSPASITWKEYALTEA